jgi:DNA-binding beta-propeller fold protein YncE
MPYQIGSPLRHILLLLLALTLAACSSAPPRQETFEPPVYPPPPDQARFIFERTLRFNTNVEKLTTLEKLRRYATGSVDDIKGLVKPYGVAAHNGRVYVTDTVQRAVIMFDIAGNDYKEFGKEKPGDLFKPVGIDVSPNGDVYVADVSARHITVFDAEGQFLRYIGNSKWFKRPAGVAVSPDGNKVYVIDTGGVDTQEHHLFIFDAHSGEHLATIGKRGSGKGEFNLPLQLTTAADGTVYVVDKGNFRIEAFDAEGHYKFSFGTIGRYPGQFFSPKGISTDPDGNIYVVDTAFGNVQVFNPKGELLMVMGQRAESSAPGNYMLPAGIDVDEKGRVYIADQFFRKVDIYKPVGLEETGSENTAASK